jgi:two-component system LytT family sensor kinase
MLTVSGLFGASLAATLLVVVGIVLMAAVVAAWTVRRRRSWTSTAEQATFKALTTMSLAAPALRGGLNTISAAAAVTPLKELLGCDAVMLTGEDGGYLGWAGEFTHHGQELVNISGEVVRTGTRQALGESEISCGRIDCEIKGAVVVPLVVDGGVVGTLCTLTTRSSTLRLGLAKATTEVARYLSTQLELAELDVSRSRLAEAEVKALRAQISPHFIYNALTTIASLIRTDQEEARELLIEFADFTRYSFRSSGEFTTLADELRNVDRYLTLERARFGDRLQVRLQIAPEVLQVVLPFLVLQPLVENAVRHGLSQKPDGGTISVVAEDSGAECVISVEDDGVGMDPVRLRTEMAGAHETGAHVGLGNVHHRLRSVFGDDYGLVVETERGAGMKVSLRVPKYTRGVRAQPAVAGPTPGPPQPAALPSAAVRG